MSAIKLIHTAKNQLGLDDDDYRAMLFRITGKTSTKLMSAVEQEKIVMEMRKCGFKAAFNGASKPLQGPFAKKLIALWIAAYNLGIVKNRTNEAMLAFVKRQSGIEHTRFLHYADDAKKVIEALKKWISREAGVDWSNEKDMADFEKRYGYKIAIAQYKIVRLNKAQFKKLPLSASNLWEPFWHEVAKIIGDCEPNKISDQQWQKVMNAFGIRLRAYQKTQEG